MTYNLSTIMHRAWAIVKADRDWRKHFAVRMRYAQRDAWAEARWALFPKTEAERVQDEIHILESKERWAPRDYEHRARLSAELQAKRDLIAASAGRFCGVTFTNKDGNKRTMLVQPAALPFHVKRETASENARQAAQTRAERHPHLLRLGSRQACGALCEPTNGYPHCRGRCRAPLRLTPLGCNCGPHAFHLRKERNMNIDNIQIDAIEKPSGLPALLAHIEVSTPD